MKKAFYMAIDQYGTHYDIGETKSPRKWLLDYFGKSSAQKMYIDNTSGETFHCGWIIGDLWLSVFEVVPMRIK